MMSQALSGLANNRRTLLQLLASWKYNVKSKIGLRQSTRIYLRYNSAKLHPDPIWNDEALGFFQECLSNNNNNNNNNETEMSTGSDMGSAVCDPKSTK